MIFLKIWKKCWMINWVPRFKSTEFHPISWSQKDLLTLRDSCHQLEILKKICMIKDHLSTFKTISQCLLQNKDRLQEFYKALSSLLQNQWLIRKIWLRNHLKEWSLVGILWASLLFFLEVQKRTIYKKLP
jgi:hypothetical protein